MKKIIIVIAGLLLAGCSSVNYNTGRKSLLIQDMGVRQKPIQADIRVGGKISGSAECKHLFGFSIKRPQEQTYGAELQVPEGNFAPVECTRGALNDALTRNNADVIIAPHYNLNKISHGCIFGKCVYNSYEVTVVGYKGKIDHFSSVEPKEVKE